MTLDQEYNEQTRWLAHLAEERQALSASLEATLADGVVLEDEEEWDDGSEGKTPAQQALIPPRLSLQSKALPRVQPGAGGSASLVVANEALDSPASSTETNIFMRLARRLTSSLAALTLSPTEGTPDSSLATKIRVEARPDGAYVADRMLHEQYEATSYREQYGDWQEARVVDAVPTPVAQPLMETMPMQEKRRLAGHTAKIRLQTTEMPAVKARNKETSASAEAAIATPMRLHETVPVTQPTLPASRLPGLAREDVRETSVKLPAVTNVRQEAESPTVLRKTLAGSGVFACGQGDLMVENPHITDASVVIITLTSNPGPVVVQYISLSPHIGFTVHLTAPVVAKTSFNYIILLGELF